MCLPCFLVPDEESTIEEQEAMEEQLNQKAELADLAKDGTIFSYWTINPWVVADFVQG